MESAKPTELPRLYGLGTGIFVVVAAMVGVGILTSSGYTIVATQSYATLLLLWAIGGLLAICGALTLAELATAMPEVGGEYVFVRVGFGPRWAFVYGWATLLVGFAGPAALISHAAIRYLVQPFTVPEIVMPIGATVLLVLFAATHCVGARHGALVQNLSTLFKLVGLLALIACGLLFGDGDFAHLGRGKGLSDQSAGVLAVSLVYVMYSYSGWNAAVYLAGEIHDAPRLVPRAVIIGTLGVTAIYVAMNLVYAYALDPVALASAPPRDVEAIAELAARQLFGPQVSSLVSIVIGLGILSSVSAYLLVGPRVSFAMARDGVFPAFAGRVHPRFNTPAAAIKTQATVAIALLWGSQLLTGGVDAFDKLLSYTGVGLTALLGLTVSSIFAVRRRSDYRPTFRVPFYPIPPLLFLLITGWILLFSFRETPWPSAISLGSLVIAYPLSFLLRGPSRPGTVISG